MKKIFLSAALIAAATQLSAATMVSPQNAYKAVLNIFAYDADGKLLRSGNAFFVEAPGVAVTSYTMLEGATRAEVIDAKGKKYAIHRILGANAATDLIKFSVADCKNTDYFTITSTAADTTTPLQMVRYSSDKKKALQAAAIVSDEAYNTYRYYQTNIGNEQTNLTCPLMDESGKLVAVVQRNVAPKATGACAIDARFINELKIDATAAFNSELRQLAIPKALPQDAKEAMAYIYMIPANDSVASYTAYNDYVNAFPQMADGYAGRATLNARYSRYEACENDFNRALEIAATDTTGLKADAIHYNWSTLIYQLAANRNDSTTFYKDWNLQKAEAEADKAYALQPYPIYLMQKGHCQLAQNNYEGAYQSYLKACEDKQFASPETYYAAALALEKTGKDTAQVITLLDQSIALLPQPAEAKFAQYYWERAARLIQAGRYREAVFDYNEYEKAIGPNNLNATFYYIRQQAEMQARMYQQALDDIHTAIATAEDPLPYLLEECLILLRVGEYTKAAEQAELLLVRQPDNADAHKIAGIAYGELGNIAKAHKHLSEAQQLGDTSVNALIQKYK